MGIRVVRGPRELVPSKATERLGPITPAFELLNNQYVRLVDQATGQVRVERGEAIIVPGPNEEAINEVTDAINVDDETAVLVMSKLSGQQRLVTDKGLFFPDKYDEDVKNNVVRNAKQVAFKIPVTKIDMRPQYAFFEYTVRTSDNVELVLEGTIFWQANDVAKMVERTGDPKGDVWYH